MLSRAQDKVNHKAPYLKLMKRLIPNEACLCFVFGSTVVILLLNGTMHGQLVTDVCNSVISVVDFQFQFQLFFNARCYCLDVQVP